MGTEVLLINKQELREIIDMSVKEAIAEISEKKEDTTSQNSTFIYGIKGLASFLGVSLPTAQLWKNQRVFPYVQRGRTIIFKSDEVLAGMASKKKSKF